MRITAISAAMLPQRSNRTNQIRLSKPMAMDSVSFRGKTIRDSYTVTVGQRKEGKKIGPVKVLTVMGQKIGNKYAKAVDFDVRESAVLKGQKAMMIGGNTPELIVSNGFAKDVEVTGQATIIGCGAEMFRGRTEKLTVRNCAEARNLKYAKTARAEGGGLIEDTPVETLELDYGYANGVNVAKTATIIGTETIITNGSANVLKFTKGAEARDVVVNGEVILISEGGKPLAKADAKGGRVTIDKRGTVTINGQEVELTPVPQESET